MALPRRLRMDGVQVSELPRCTTGAPFRGDGVGGSKRGWGGGCSSPTPCVTYSPSVVVLRGPLFFTAGVSDGGGGGLPTPGHSPRPLLNRAKISSGPSADQKNFSGAFGTN